MTCLAEKDDRSLHFDYQFKKIIQKLLSISHRQHYFKRFPQLLARHLLFHHELQVQSHHLIADHTDHLHRYSQHAQIRRIQPVIFLPVVVVEQFESVSQIFAMFDLNIGCFFIFDLFFLDLNQLKNKSQCTHLLITTLRSRSTA
jgi:hypothetical protein